MPDECLARALLPWSLASSGLDHVVEIERSACAPFFNALVMLLGVFLLTHSDDQSWRLADSRKNATILFALCLLCGSAVSSAAISGILEATDATLSCTARSLPPLAVGVALGLRASQKPWTTFLLLGLCVGSLAAFYVFTVVRLFLFELLLVGAVGGAYLGLRLKAYVVPATTSLLAAFLFTLGFTYLLLVPSDGRYARWLTRLRSKRNGFGIDLPTSSASSSGSPISSLASELQNSAPEQFAEDLFADSSDGLFASLKPDRPLDEALLDALQDKYTMVPLIVAVLFVASREQLQKLSATGAEISGETWERARKLSTSAMPRSRRMATGNSRLQQLKDWWSPPKSKSPLQRLKDWWSPSEPSKSWSGSLV